MAKHFLKGSGRYPDTGRCPNHCSGAPNFELKVVKISIWPGSDCVYLSSEHPQSRWDSVSLRPSLFYRASSRTAEATQKNPVSKRKEPKTQSLLHMHFPYRAEGMLRANPCRKKEPEGEKVLITCPGRPTRKMKRRK